MKLSIIVPVYKVEDYLEKCVMSILNQSFSDFELILVNDGSPDNCGNLCDIWAQKDARIKVIHKKNGGLSDARNAGIDIAQGEYIGFVDSDDYIKENMFEILVNNIEKYDADISMCGYANVYGDGVRKMNSDQSVEVMTQEQAIHKILIGRELSVHAYTKLYKRALFQKVRYPVGKISEDAYIIMDIMDQVKKAVFTPCSLYFYVHREDSINTSKFTSKDMTRIEAHKKNYIYIKKKHPSLQKLAYERYLGSIAFVAHKIVMSNEKYDNDKVRWVFKTLRKNLIKIYGAEYFSIKRKVLISILLINKHLYRIVIRTAQPLAT
ncbi:MAG: glycosyltransferase [Ruminococcus flavefaciens]|jgi:glycosyltransferase involved in cell wall biosynthesis|nr:glycosyltransferase [Ruminococcus flavefaciens]